MKKVSVFVVLASAVALIAYSKKVQAEEERYDYALNIGAISRHDTGSKVNDFNQVNPMIGIRVYAEHSFLGGHPYLEADYIQKNSVGGKTIIAGGGIQWKIIPSETVDLCGGIQAFYMHYENPRDQTVWNGPLASPYLCLEKKNVALNFVRLGSKVLFVYLSVKF